MPWILFALLVVPTLGFWWAQHYFQRIAWRHMTPTGEAAEREPSLRRRLGRYRPEHFDPTGWQAHRMARLCFWAAPLWWLGLGVVIAPALGLFGPLSR